MEGYCNSMVSHSTNTDNARRCSRIMPIMLAMVPFVILSLMAGTFSRRVVSHSTLLVLIQTSDGLVVCADKRAYNRVRGATDNDTKIVQLGKRAGFALSGARAVLNPKDFRKEFDFEDVVRECFTKMNVEDMDRHWDMLQEALTNAVAVFSKRVGPGDVPPDGSSSNSLNALYFFYIDQTGVIRIMQFECKRLMNSQRSIEVTRTNLEPHFFADGQVEVLTELLRGHDERFNDIRMDPSYRRRLVQSYNKTISANEAVQFAQQIIRITSERHHLISTSPSLVSTNYDCIILTKDNGFTWLGR